MGCATGIVKLVVFIFNFVCAIVGIVLIAVGSTSYVSVNKFENIIEYKTFNVVPVAVITLGVIIFVISFLGCCGVCQKNQCMLNTYAVILLLLFVCQLALGIYGYLQVKGDVKKLKETVTTELDTAFQHYYDNKDIQDSFNYFQQELHCCGVHSFKDYITSPSNKFQVPGSCCRTEEVLGVCTDTNLVYHEGCAPKLVALIEKILTIVSYVAMGICAVEVIGALFAFCLVNSYRNDSRRGYA